MKRDFDLIRSILLQVESAPAGQPIMEMSSPADIDGPTFIGHLKLMIDDELIDGEILSTQQIAFGVYGLKQKGHDFLALAKSDVVWATAKAKAAKVGGSVSTDILLSLLEQSMRAELGLK